MKKGFLLIVIFLVLLGIHADYQGIKEKYIDNNQITATISTKENKEDVKNIIMHEFVVPCVIVFAVYTCVYIGYPKFKIGAIKRRPKFRKQMPRGNLVLI